MKSLLMVALSQYGIKEIPGPEHSPEILKYFRQCGFSEIRDDETAWCSVFINWVAYIAGYEQSRGLAARSWLNVDGEVKTPEPGDVVIFWRESLDSWKGHVGLFLKESKDHIHVLGGNQNNSVCIKKYPSSRLLGYRRLRFVSW